MYLARTERRRPSSFAVALLWHSAHGEETKVGCVCNRELVQPGDGHMSDDNT